MADAQPEHLLMFAKDLKQGGNMIQILAAFSTKGTKTLNAEAKYQTYFYNCQNNHVSHAARFQTLCLHIDQKVRIYIHTHTHTNNELRGKENLADHKADL